MESHVNEATFDREWHAHFLPVSANEIKRFALAILREAFLAFGAPL